MEAYVGLACDRQRLVQERVGLCVKAAVERDLGSPLQRERLARCGRDLAVKLHTRREVGVRLVELSGEQLRLAPYRHRERAPARGLAQVRGTRLGFEVWPQRLDHLVAREAVPVGQRQQLHKLGGAATRPCIRRDLIAADIDAEPAEQLYADGAVLRFRGHRLPDPRATLHEERFGNTGPEGSHELDSKEHP